MFDLDWGGPLVFKASQIKREVSQHPSCRSVFLLRQAADVELSTPCDIWLTALCLWKPTSIQLPSLKQNIFNFIFCAKPKHVLGKKTKSPATCVECGPWDVGTPYECSQLCCTGEGDAEHGGPPLSADYKHPTEGRLLWRESTDKVKSSTCHRTP